MSVLEILRLIWCIVEFSFESIWYNIWGAEIRDEENITDKVVIITGANVGIGKSIAIKMAKRGAIVVIACRNEVEGKKAQEDIQYEARSRKVVLMKLDLEDFKSIKSFATDVSLRYPEVHLLINNAGVCIDSKDVRRTSDGYELHMAINHLGHFLLTNLMLKNIKQAAPSRIVIISSTSLIFSKLDLEDLHLTRNKNPTKHHVLPLTTLPYNNSKFANSLFAKELGRRLEGTGVNVYSVCPGLANTNIFREFTEFGKIIQKIGLKLVGLSTTKAADSVLYCALSRKCDHETGKFYRFEQICSSGNRKLKTDAAKRLWEISENTVNFYMN